MKGDLQNMKDHATCLSQVVTDLYNHLVSKDAGEQLPEFKGWRALFTSGHGDRGLNRPVRADSIARTYGLGASDLQLTTLLFAIHSALSLHAILTAHRYFVDSRCRPSPSMLEDLLSGATFLEHGLENYPGSTFSSWLLSELADGDLDNVIDLTYEAVSVPADHTPYADDFKQLHQGLVPRSIRHSIGAYYTPTWLAQFVLEQVVRAAPETSPILTVLDPTCGSGTFLLAAHQFLHNALGSGDADAGVDVLLNRLCGFDNDPLAVLAAKTNLLLTLVHLASRGAKLPSDQWRLPVFLADVVLAGRAKISGTLTLALNGSMVDVPCEIASERSRWHRFVADLTADTGGSASSVDDRAIRSIRDALMAADIERRALPQLGALAEAPAPLWQRPFDLVVGNPPWVNWEYLPSAYRARVGKLWPLLGLYDLRGLDRANSKEDIASLITYLVADQFLAPNGTLGFVVPQALFKSSLNAKGFRRFHVGANRTAMRVVGADDLSAVSPFGTSGSRTGVLYLIKGQSTEYPVPYRLWTQSEAMSPSSTAEWAEAMPLFNITTLTARPIDRNDVTSPWTTGTDAEAATFDAIAGQCAYRARTGVFTGGANAVYYLHVEDVLSSGHLIVSNITERAKRTVPSVTAEVEADFVYPLALGRNVHRWHSVVDVYILCPHTVRSRMRPLPPLILQSEAPLTYAYLAQFENALLSRGGFATWERPYLAEAFYALQRIGEYTFAPYKVVWRYISKTFECCVLGPSKGPNGEERSPMPHEKLMMIGVDNEDEAYYLCGILSSSPARRFVESHMVGTQIAPHVISTLAVPVYDASCADHRAIADICRRGHASQGAPRYETLLPDLDQVVADLWGLRNTDVESLRAGLTQHRP